MAQIKNLIAKWGAAWPSPMIISRQYDNGQYRIDLFNYPEPEHIVDEQTEQMEVLSYYLIVWMKETEDGEPREMSPIQLPGPYWIVPNYYTQLVQDIRFQFCVQSDSTDYEAHSAIFTGRIVDSIEHDGDPVDVTPAEMFDAYKAYVNDLIVAAGAVVIDPNLDTAGAAADAKATGDALSSINERLDAETIARASAVSAETARAEAEEARIEALFTGDVSDTVNEWLNEHPEATTTVQDGSLTEAKFSNNLKLATVKDYVTPEMFGAVGDGSTNDEIAINQAVSFAVNNHMPLVFTDGKEYFTESGIIISTPPNVIRMDGRLKYTGSGTALVVGSNSAQVADLELVLSAKGDSTPNLASTGIKLININTSKIVINAIENFGIGLEMVGYGGAFAYNSVYVTRIYRNGIGLKLNSIGTGGYCNENKFFGGRISISSSDTKATSVGVLVTSENSYDQNSNVFYSPCIEGLGTGVKIEHGRTNRFFYCRTEATTTPFDIVSDANTYNYMSVSYGISSKFVVLPSQINAYVDSFELTLSRFSYTLFDSHNVYDTAVSHDTGVSAKGFMYVRNGEIKPHPWGGSRDDATKAVKMYANQPLMCMVNTVLNKDFYVIPKADNGYRYVIFMWDNNGELITDGYPFGYNEQSYNKTYFTKIASGALTNGWATGADTTEPFIIHMPSTCVKACIGITASSIATPVIFRQLVIKTVKPDIVCDVPSAEYPVLSAIPTSTAKKGQIVINAGTGSNYGWVYNGTSWNELS